MKTLIAMICLIGAASAQTLTITDNSPADSPLRFSGTVSLDSGPDAVCSITGHNNDSRTIVAWVIQLQGVKPNGQPYGGSPSTVDLFFKSEAKISKVAPKPGLDFDNSQLRCPDFGRTYGSPETTEPSMTIKAVLVQFDDGSIWGDPAAAKELAFQRQQAIDYLRSVQAAPDLKKAVAKEPPIVLNPGPHDHMLWEKAITWSYLSDDPTPEAIAADIKNRLALAQVRNAWMAALK